MICIYNYVYMYSQLGTVAIEIYNYVHVCVHNCFFFFLLMGMAVYDVKIPVKGGLEKKKLVCLYVFL